MVKTSPLGLAVGVKVQLHSLANDTEYNGCSATVVALEGDKASVRLDSGPERGRRLKVPHRFLAVDMGSIYAPGADQVEEGEKEDAAI